MASNIFELLKILKIKSVVGCFCDLFTFVVNFELVNWEME